MNHGSRLLVFLACSALAAEDPAIADPFAAADGTTDLRFQAGTYATFDRVSTSTDGTAVSTDREIGHGTGRTVELAVVHTAAKAGPLTHWLLIGVAARHARGDDDLGTRHSTIAAGGELGGGLCLRLGRHVQLEVGPVLTLGWCDNSVEDDPDSGSAARDATRSAWYGSIDVRAGLWATLDSFQVGIVAGSAAHMLQLSSRVDAESPWTDTAYGGSGTFVMAGIGTRF